MIRNSAGLVMAAGSVKLCGSFPPLLAETLAIRRGMQLALETGLSPLLLESDCLGAINAVKARSVLCSDMGLVLADICSLSSNLNVVSFSFIPREANKVADSLAKFALGLSSDLFWLESCPPCGELLVHGDFHG
ncbi:hypothetical protein ACOSQ4_026569 [Xanthoceras sorbifolium]